MAKYIGTYATSGDVQTALDNQELSRPFIAYTTDNKKVIYGPTANRAEVGDIVVYSVADDLLHYIKQTDYNITSYPVASYVPVGVVAYPQTDDAILGPSGEITFMGLNYLDTSRPDTGVNSSTIIAWGYNNFDIPELTNYANSGTAITDMNGKANTEIVLQYATAQTDWRTASAITANNAAGYYPVFECAWRYHTSGTVQGDWYIPATGQQHKIDFGKISDSLELVGRGRIAGNIPFFSSTENNNKNCWVIDNSRAEIKTSPKIGGAGRAIPYCSKLMTRI